MYQKLFSKFLKFFKISDVDISAPSDLWSLFLFVHFATPILLTFCGVDMCVKIICNILCNLIYIGYTGPYKKFTQISKDTVLAFFLSIIFGQPLVPRNFFESILWALYTASSVNIFDRIFGALFISAGCLVTAPLLVLDWMRWWQRWPIPNILGVSFANIFMLLFIKLRK